MKNKKPSIIITGASGFIGKYILEYLIKDYQVFAIARRSRKLSNVPYHKNLHWLQCDIANKKTLTDVKNYIIENGGADYIIHLAAYYDFTYTDNPEYQRTNIDGTENILNIATELNVKRFIFAGSLAACNFPEKNKVITEQAPLDADYAYAWSKRKGEELVKEYSNKFPCSIIRFAAVFSDWCEYAPLYKFLTSWLSNKYYSRILAGNGESAIPYIHVHDLLLLVKKIISKTDKLLPFDVYNASPDGSTSHHELFKFATRYFLGESIKPIFLPKLLAYPALMFRILLMKFRLTSEEYFERLWMIKYIGLKLNVDSSYTRETLDWEPTPRYHIMRRLLFLLEKMKSHPVEWNVKNEAALKRVTRRSNLLIYEAMIEEKENLLKQININILLTDSKVSFSRYKLMDSNEFMCYMSTLYHLLMAVVRSGDRSLMLKYIDDIALKRFAEGFEPKEICDTLSVFRDVILKNFISKKSMSEIKQELYDYIGLTIQMAQDEVEDLYDNLIHKMPKNKFSESSLLPDCNELQKMIKQLSAFYQIAPEEIGSKKDLITE
ncbi:MAG: NAD(P)-dependent oxidoreductase [Ignavibacteriae bacterium]|nr:NAD(P)-dependent oxidoreductase [Ignavibacteriota bacterium]NOG96467.1 NAD(P)-dependent oxidoreductase [Ignavibacteriota bacterium]